MPDLTVIILTYNEEKHIERALRSVKKIADVIWVVDSFSTDNTLHIAEDMGAQTVKNVFTNHAAQFAWALENCNISTTWVMRLDADEYLTENLVLEIKTRLHMLKESITGIVLKRQVHFMGKWIRFGGYYPVKLLRIWRTGAATMEQRWMDEHVVLSHGETVTFDHDFVDDNLNSLTWWTMKHNDYATREAIDLLNKKYGFYVNDDRLIQSGSSQQIINKRWYKDNVYGKMPLFLRSLFYFLYRYFIKLGFLDGKKGLIWHFLQGFWYRFLVDSKIYQMEYLAFSEKKSIKDIIEEKFNFKI